MAITKQINQLNNAGEIQSSDYVALAQSGQSEATKATISDLAAAVGELNSTGALSELSLATSIGKNLIAQCLTEKGVPTSPSETLVQMADKIEGLDIADGMDKLKAVLVNQDSYTENFVYSYCCRIQGTNMAIALDSTGATAYLLDALNNYAVLTSISTGFTTSLSSSSYGTTFTFSCDASHVVVKCNSEVVSLKISSTYDQENDTTTYSLSVEGRVTTLASQYNCPMIVNKAGTKLLALPATSGSSTTYTALRMYNLLDGSNTTCTNVNSTPISPCWSSMSTNIDSIGYIYCSSDDSTVYSLGSCYPNSSDDTYNVQLYTSIINWDTPSFTFGTSNKLISFKGRDNTSYSAIYINTIHNMFYRVSTEYVNTYNDAISLYTRYITAMDMTTGEQKTLKFYRLRYYKDTYSRGYYVTCTSIFVKHIQDKDIIYTEGGKFEYSFTDNKLSIVSKHVDIDGTYLSSIQYLNTATNSISGSHSLDTYMNGNVIKFYCGNTNPFSALLNGQYSSKLATSPSRVTTDVSNLDDDNAKQYVFGNVYRRNGKHTFFQYPYNIITTSALNSGMFDVETTIAYLPEDSDESI